MFFFKKSKKKAREKHSPAAGRAPRYESLAMVNINGYEGAAVLRNVSQSGFRMESKTYVEIETGSSYTIRIDPQPFINMMIFEAVVEVRWAQSSEEKFSLGLMLAQGDNFLFRRYVEHIKTQAENNPPESEEDSV
jgi:hypothetical protein